MTLLITRPAADAAPLAARLQDMGYRTFVESLLEPDLSRAGTASLSAHKAVLLTSRNGARAYALATPDRSAQIFAVGDSTASLARDLGFACVASAGGDIHDLYALVRADWSPGDGRLLHVAGKTLAGDLVGMLADAGYDVLRDHLYDVRTPPEFTPELVDAFVRDDITAVLLFSPRTAATFADLVVRGAIGDRMRRCYAVCLSDAVRDRVSALSWRDTVVARSPTQDALIEVLQTVCPSGQTG
ncbi:MAG: uroporphyrinogen-III synthase [Rhodospirillales bacterium]